MARISTYSQDSTMNRLDKVVGSDSATNSTKNYTIQSIIDLINDISGINLFDGVKFRFQAYDADATDPSGILNITGTSTISTDFSAISQVIVSKKNLQEVSVDNYLSSLNGQTIKITQVDNIDNFGIYKVTAIQDYTNDKYFQLTLTELTSNGSIDPQTVYFIGLFNVDNVIDFNNTSVTSLQDVTDAGSGQIITDNERIDLNAAVLHTEVVNNLTSTSTDDPLSANQGRVLKGLIDSINNLLDVDTEDENVLDNLRDIVNYIQTNRTTLNSLSIASISGLQTALNGKQNTETGKGLSEEDFTTLLLQKLNGISSGAQPNVQTDWNGTGDAAILNKPTNFIFTTSSVTNLSDVNNVGSGYIITDAERNKITLGHTSFIGLSPQERGKLFGVENNADVTDTQNVVAALTPGTNISIAADGTINATDTNDNTTYDLTVAQSGDNAQISLEGSDNVDDNITLVAGNNIDLTVNAGNTTIDVDLTTGAVADGATTLVTGDHVFDHTSNFARKDQNETFAGNVTIQGNLTVSGTQQTVLSNDVNIGDATITLNSDLDSSTAPSENAGIDINRGNASTVSIRWDEQNDKWQFTNDGTTYEDINADHPLNDLTDVNITNLQNNQVLKYNSTTSKWENQAEGGSIDGTGSANKIAIWSDTDSLTNDTNLHWNSSSNYLGVNVSNPQRPLHVNGTIRLTSGSYGDWDFDRYYGVASLVAPSATSGFHFGTSSNPSYATLTPVYLGKLGVGTTSPAASIDAGDNTDAIIVPKGTDTERDALTAESGMFRFNTTSNEFEGYNGTEWGAIAGSGGATSTFNKDLFSGDDNTSSFTMAQTIADENNTQVYIDGVYQSKENYTVNGTAINFSTAPPAGTNNIEVISVTSVALDDTNTLTRDGFTGDGITRAFTLSVSPTNVDLTFVYIQGVYQEKSTYSISGSTITFTTAPQNGYTFEVMSLTAANITQTSYMASDSFSTPTQGQTSFTLVNGTPSNKSFTMVFISGVYQDKSTYSLTNGAIVLSQGVDAEDTVEVISIGNGGVISKPVSDANDARYSVNVISANDTAVAGAVYVFTASLTLTLPASPEVGESIKISNLSETTTCVLGRNGNKIMGDAEDLTLDTASASFELIYSGTAKGWVIIGQ